MLDYFLLLRQTNFNVSDDNNSGTTEKPKPFQRKRNSKRKELEITR